ncbi:polysaccharide biosynthesis tyrosine autokinase [Nocardioides litoris]|uniref:polysaccharide biosynthesis tyrosine autokinase n=1 Tax=Nocardioides litoris TaxID=1926648 RepID=UPI001476C581|nr:polysaccharide biosynthesis tyrosine autokinase [Nocardioides litoris]
MLEFLTTLARRWRVVVTAVLLGVAAAALATSQLTPSYRAESQLFVALASTGDSADALAQGELFAVNRVKSYPVIADSPQVLEPVIADLGLDVSPEELAEEVEAEAVPQTVLISITVTDPSAARSAEIANAVSAQFIEVVESLDRVDEDSPSPVKVTVVRPAVAPASASFPVPAINLAVGLLAGLALGIAGAALRETLDQTVRDEDDVEQATGLGTLGVVPTNTHIDAEPVLAAGASDVVWAESYRKLRTNLSYLDPDDPPRVLMVTSALSGDGKTVTAANLAASLAQTGLRTILVEADLRRPSLAGLLELSPDVGVTSVVSGKASVADVTQRAASGMDVLTCGPIPPNPSELLGSRSFKRLVAGLLETHDRVIIDTPPLVAVTDAAVTSVVADAVIVVCTSRGTTRPDLRRAVEALRAVDAPLAGVVLNQVSLAGRSYRQYTYEPDERPRARRDKRDRDTRVPAPATSAAPRRTPGPGGADAPVLDDETADHAPRHASSG